MAEEITVEGAPAPKELQEVLDEVNARFTGQEDREAIAGWLNEVVQLAYAGMPPSIPVPLDGDGIPVYPGDMVKYPDEGEDEAFAVLAVNADGVAYYSKVGGSIPTSAAVASQFEHVTPKPEPSDCLRQLVSDVLTSKNGEEVEAAYAKCLEMLDSAYGVENGR